MESDSLCAECLCLDSPEDRELIVPDEIIEVGGSGGVTVDPGTSGGSSWGSKLDCGGPAGGGSILSPTEIGWLATAPKDCCDGRKACVPLT